MVLHTSGPLGSANREIRVAIDAFFEGRRASRHMPSLLKRTLLTIVAIESGGWLMLRVVRGRQPVPPFQQAFFRAGYAHAGDS